MKICSYISFLWLAACLLIFPACTPQHPVVCNLKCEYLENPLAIDNPAPLLSWQMQSAKKGKMQTAYRILVSDTPQLLEKDVANYWDSGIVSSSGSVQVRYEGKTPVSRKKLYWKVKVWDEEGQTTSWSETAAWETGLLQPTDWSAHWIAFEEDSFPDSKKTGPAPYFRKEFNLRKNIRKARMYICGLGFYEMYLNGNKVGDQVLAPAVTNYDVRPLKHLIYHYDDQSTQRCLYNTFDITSALRKGTNTVGIVLGNGWYNQRNRTVEGDMWYSTPRMIAQLEVEFEDGSTQSVCTDNSWKTTTGPLLHNSIFQGEVYDARREPGEWLRNGYDDSGWNASLTVRPPAGELQPQLAPFDKIIDTIRPEYKGKENDSTYVYALPGTVSGWAALNLEGKAGNQVELRFISEEGDDYGQSDTYILKGGGKESWEPRFTWHAFRFIKAISRDVELNEESILVKVVHTAAERNGNFSCSNEFFNKIHDAYLRTQEANFHGSISSDCPHRERLGYTGDGQVIAESCLLTFDMTQFFRKWLNDIDDARNKKTGYVTHTAPFGGGGGGPAWGSAFVIMPWVYYGYYGDTTILEQHYNGMKQWVEYLGTRTDEHGIVVREEPHGWCLGDWCTPDRIRIPEPLVNTAYYYYCTDLMHKIASILGKEKDVTFFTHTAAQIKENFNQAFYNPETRHYWEGKQGADVFALAFGLVPEENIQSVFEAMLTHLESIGYHFDTGILGTPLLLDVLTRYGRSDLAYRVMNQRKAPGFAYLLDDANSTLWENWNGEASRCHPMFGSVVAWFYRSLAGINIDETNAGMQHILIKPQVTGDLTYCKASYASLYGLIRSEWEKSKDGSFRLTVEIPANTTATICLPNENNLPVTESGIPAEQAAGIRTEENREGKTVLNIGSGTYTFTIKQKAG